MSTTIKCPECGKEFEVSEAFRHQIEETVLAGERANHERELAEARASGEEAAKRKARDDFELTTKQLQESAQDERARNANLQEQLLSLTRELRQARQEKDDARLEMEKTLTKEQERIREESRKRAFEEHELKDKEKDQKLREALRQIDDLKAKIEQGSQQIQGEVLELELEQLLMTEFPADRISEVKKGQRGADIVQVVVDDRGRECGTILWESKNAQWSETWAKKLRDDQRQLSAQVAVLVVANPPADMKAFTFENGIWVSTRSMVTVLALALRFDLIHVYQERMSAVGKNEKMDVLYTYLTGIEFRHRVEGLVEAFTNLQQDIEKEKRWFHYGHHAENVGAVVARYQVALFATIRGIVY